MATSESSEPSESADPAESQSDLPFEQALERLEGVVDRLERGDLELEASLTAFEEGVRLSRHCATQLEAAEQRIEILVREGGTWLAKPFDAEEDALDEDAVDEYDDPDAGDDIS